MALCDPGDTILSLPIKSGGHLSHGLKVNFSGTFYNIVDYDLDPETERLDYDAIESIARACKPRMIICGYSAYPRTIDFARFRAIADGVGAVLMADIAHIAGLCATGAHPSPFPHAHVVTTTTHKTLRGPRGGLILTNDEDLAKKINKALFPGVQGGPLMHIISAKAVALGENLKPEFTAYCKRVVANAKALAAALAGHGYRLCSGGTDNHLMLVDLRPRGLNGKIASEALDHAGITVNKNGIPFDTEKITLGGGIRIGTPAVTTRGMKEAEMKTIAGLIHQVLENREKPDALAKIRGEVIALNRQFPLP
jgi:glycine/serine hydroxymethyltransferase